MVKVKNNPQLRNSTPFKLGTFCSGIGSPEQSLKELNANHINVFACEKDKFARQTYLANFTPGIMLEDMTKETYDDPELYADLVVAGIPCQSFSLAGKRQGENDPRGLLIYDFIRYVRKRRPKVFIIENVKGLLSDAGGVTFGKWLELLGCSRNGQPNMFNHPESLGYNLNYRVLNAKHYGLPQNRERVFIVGIRPDLPNSYVWPKRVVLKDRLIDLLESEVDEKYYLSDLMMSKFSECGTFINQDIQSSRVHDIFGCVPANIAGTHGYSMGYIKSVAFNGNQKKKIHTENDIASCLNIGSNASGSYNNLTLLHGAKFEANRIYDSNGIAKTQKSNGGGGGTKTGYYSVKQLNQSKESGCKQPYQQNRVYDSNGLSTAIDQVAGRWGTNIHRIRRLTPLECMRLMGYPDSFIKPCSETQTYKQAGNSIPIHMMKVVLKPLLPLLENTH